MPVPVSQMTRVVRHVVSHRLRGVDRYPLVLMLEPLMRCNLACAGCGKIQHPVQVLRRQLTPQQCWDAAEECGAPIVSIPGGEPLLHPHIDEIVNGLIKQKRYVYLCTNAIKLEESLHLFKPSKYLAFSVHLDGPREEHDEAVCKDGVYDVAIAAIRAARKKGFRVTTNSTLFQTSQAESMGGMFDHLMELGVEGMMISPGYGYEKAPDQDNFLDRQQTQKIFRRVLRDRRRSWKFNQTPLFLEFLQGKYELDCTPWGNPTFNIFGWQRPCYLLDEGYCDSFQELMETTDWDAYGHQSGNSKCKNCMVHCGFEPTAVAETFGTWRGFWHTVRSVLGWNRDLDKAHDADDSEADQPRHAA